MPGLFLALLAMLALLVATWKYPAVSIPARSMEPQSTSIPRRIFFSLPAAVTDLHPSTTFLEHHPTTQLTVGEEPQRRAVIALSSDPDDMRLYDQLRATGHTDYARLLVALLRLNAMGGLFVQGRASGALCEADWWTKALHGDIDLVVVRDSPLLEMHALRTDVLAARAGSAAVQVLLRELRALGPQGISMWRGRAREWFGSALNKHVAGYPADHGFVLGRSRHGFTKLRVLELTPGGEVHLTEEPGSPRVLASAVQVR